MTQRGELAATAILSDLTVHMKYARYVPELGRRETWEEIVDRNKWMHQKKFPALRDEIEANYRYVYDRKVLPSMRSMQFAGKAIEVGAQRIFNCSFLPLDHPDAFSELMFLLLSGCGVGYSVQRRHSSKLPIVRGPLPKRRRFLVGDSIEGWADAVKILIEAYLHGKADPDFDFRSIRPKGTQLVTSGGVAPGPQPLKDALHNARKVLDAVGAGNQLSPLQAHDICCHLADAVLAGGIRRSAMIALFDVDDDEMLACKAGRWFELNPQRARCNNTAVLLRHRVDHATFCELWERVKASGAGEPGLLLSNDPDVGTNPCGEVALGGGSVKVGFCNLGTINSSDLGPGMQAEFEARARAAAFICTLQASYTDFHYLRDCWRESAEKEALIGVSMTGIAAGGVLELDVEAASKIVREVNAQVAGKIGIRPAARCTVVKPEGTGSNVLSHELACSSGVHAYHAPFYKRRFRVGKDEPVYQFLSMNHPELLEDDFFKPADQAVITIPVRAPDKAITRESETAVDLLERVKDLHTRWIRPSHRKGANTNNVSTTVTVKADEWDAVRDWMWANRDSYTALSVLPADDHTYVQAPFEECSEDEYTRLLGHFSSIDLSRIREGSDTTNLAAEPACAGGSCEIETTLIPAV